jgi:anti-sigma regulatory factor (Ser/Thr protein kinase)
MGFQAVRHLACVGILAFCWSGFACEEDLLVKRLPERDTEILSGEWYWSPTSEAVGGRMVKYFIDTTEAATTADPSQANRAGLVAEELLANAIKHANKWEAHRKVWIRVTFEQGFAELEVADEGDDFFSPLDDEDIRNQTRFRTGEEDMDEIVLAREAMGHISPYTGRGILLIQNIAEDLEYKPNPFVGGKYGTYARARIPAVGKPIAVD